MKPNSCRHRSHTVKVYPWEHFYTHPTLILLWIKLNTIPKISVLKIGKCTLYFVSGKNSNLNEGFIYFSSRCEIFLSFNLKLITNIKYLYTNFTSTELNGRPQYSWSGGVTFWATPSNQQPQEKKLRKAFTSTFYAFFELLNFLNCICSCVISKINLISCWLLECHLKKSAGSRSLIQCTDPRVLIKTSRIQNTGSSPDHRISKPRKITLTCQIRTVLSWLPEARCELSRLRLNWLTAPLWPLKQ